MCLQSIQTPNSWLFHVTRIYTLEYNVRNQTQNYNSFHDIFDTTDNSHNNLNMEIIIQVCTCLIY
jgi:hypothetical protein